jgi:hypothetical protein
MKGIAKDKTNNGSQGNEKRADLIVQQGQKELCN